MLVSELIANLEQLRESYGELDVKLNIESSVRNVYYMEDGQEEIILLSPIDMHENG